MTRRTRTFSAVSFAVEESLLLLLSSPMTRTGTVLFFGEEEESEQKKREVREREEQGDEEVEIERRKRKKKRDETFFSDAPCDHPPSGLAVVALFVSADARGHGNRAPDGVRGHLSEWRECFGNKQNNVAGG